MCKWQRESPYANSDQENEAVQAKLYEEVSNAIQFCGWIWQDYSDVIFFEVRKMRKSISLWVM